MSIIYLVCFNIFENQIKLKPLTVTFPNEKSEYSKMYEDIIYEAHICIQNK